MRRRLLAFAVLLAACLAANQAQAASDAPAPTRAPRGRFYGWQLIVAQGLAVSLGTTQLLLPNHYNKIGILAAELGAGTLGGVFIHAYHGYPLRSFVGFGLHMGGFGIGSIAALNLACSEGCTDTQETTALFIGWSIGVLATTTLDALSFGYDAPMEGFDFKARKRSSLVESLRPLVAVDKERATFGLAGVF